MGGPLPVLRIHQVPDCPSEQMNGFGPSKNDTEFNEEGLKSFQDNNDVLVQLYFTKLLVVRILIGMWFSDYYKANMKKRHV